MHKQMLIPQKSFVIIFCLIDCVFFIITAVATVDLLSFPIQNIKIANPMRELHNFDTDLSSRLQRLDN